VENAGKSGKVLTREPDWKDSTGSWRYSLARQLVDFHLLAGANGYDDDLIGFDRVNDPNPISISIHNL
jgi:hypothetical protein